MHRKANANIARYVSLKLWAPSAKFPNSYQDVTKSDTDIQIYVINSYILKFSKRKILATKHKFKEIFIEIGTT